MSLKTNVTRSNRASVMRALAQSLPIPIAWQNMPFTWPTQARYLRAFYCLRKLRTWGEQGDLRAEIGLLQVSVCVRVAARLLPIRWPMTQLALPQRW